MTAERLNYLLGILLAIAALLLIDCYKDGELLHIDWSHSAESRFDPDSLTTIPDSTQLKMCLIDAANIASCSPDTLGMRGGSIDIHKIYGMAADTNINCLSYYFVYEPSPDPNKQGYLYLIFHGNRYVETGAGTYSIRRLTGPTYASDMLCPINCPM